MGRYPHPSLGSASSDRVPRLDPVVHPGVSGPLSETELQAFEADGYLVLAENLSPEHVSDALDETNERVKRGAVPVLHERDSLALRSVFRVHMDPGPALSSIVAHPALVGAARQILGSDVYIHESRVDFRTLDVGEFYWRSDYERWHAEERVPTMRAVTACILLTASVAGNGPVLVIPGSHNAFVPCVDARQTRSHRFGRQDDCSVIPRAALTWLIGDGGITAVTGGPGTVVLLDCNLLHAAPGSLSPHQNATLFVAFNSVANRPVVPW